MEGVESLVEDLDGHADFDVVGCDFAQVRHEPHAFVELDERDDVGVLHERHRRILRHHVAVHGAAAGGHDVSHSSELQSGTSAAADDAASDILCSAG